MEIDEKWEIKVLPVCQDFGKGSFLEENGWVYVSSLFVVVAKAVLQT